MDPAALFFVLVVLAFIAHWLGRNFTPKLIGEWGPLIFNLFAAAFAIAASALLAQEGWISGALQFIAGLGSFGVAVLGVAAFAAPFLVLLVVGPASWCKLALSTVMLAVFLLVAPLQAYAFPGALGQLSKGLTDLGTSATSQVTSGLIA